MTGADEFNAMRERSQYTLESCGRDKMRYRRALYIACGNDKAKVMAALEQADAEKEAASGVREDSNG